MSNENDGRLGNAGSIGNFGKAIEGNAGIGNVNENEILGSVIDGREGNAGKGHANPILVLQDSINWYISSGVGAFISLNLLSPDFPEALMDQKIELLQ